MPSNPLIRAVTRNRKGRNRGRVNATISSVHGGDKPSHDQLVRTSLQPNQDGLQKVTFASQSSNERSQWVLYNDLALIYDREMIKEWDDGLSLMLVFGALFSGVLTAFITSSIGLLTEESNPDVNVILQTISHQLSNSSTEPYIWQDKPLDHPRSWTVKVNALFFTSLGCTLIVSLVSVLCLQWIRDFDKGLASITNPQERALKRQFRLEGIKKWHLPTIIGILPTLLVVALILFMAGMVVWLRGISRKVTIISCVILILGGGFYIITGLLAAIFPSAPFNSSSSRLVELTLLAIVHSLKSLYRRHFVSRVSRDEWKLASSIASKNFTFSVGHRQHEDEAIASNLKLPSASLLWLLSHIDVTTGTMQRLEDILDELLHVKGPESMLDSYEKYRVPWSKILAFLADQIDQVELERPSFEPKTLARVEILAQVAGVVGIQSYSETLYDLFSSPPTALPNFHSSPAGVYCRFARWRWGDPMPEDRSTPPQLLQALARVSNQSSPAFALAWLSELRLLLLQQDFSREFVLEVLIELCNAQVPDPLPFFTQDVPVMYFSDVLHHVIMTTIMVLTPTMGRRSLSRAQAQPLDQLFGMLITSYGNSRARSRQYHHQHPKEVDLLMKHLVHAMLMEFANLSTEVQKGAMTQMRRPAIRALVQGNPEPVCGIEGGPESMTTDHHYHYIENGLQALVRGGTRWADEVTNLLFGYLRMKRRKGKLDIVREHLFAVDVLFTVAYLGSRDVEKEEVGGSTMVGIYNGRSSLITALDALSSLSSAMDTPSSAFLISSGIGSNILPILGKWLEREETEELVYKVSQIGDKTLRWYAYQFLGWKYDDILPGPQDDTYWESPAWRQALFQWSMLPLRSRYSDNTVLETLVHRANRKHDLIILNYFSTRLSEQKLEETEYRKDNTPACLQLLSAALSVFPLVPHLTVSTLGFVNRIIDFQSGMRHFIDYGGLDWLAGLPQEVRSAESKHDHEGGEEGDDKIGATKAFTTTDPFYVLLTWFDKGYLDSLDDQYLSTILHSRLVSTYADDREPKWFLGFVVRAVNQLSNPPNASATSGKPLVVFTEAADCCTRILNHQISQYGSSSSVATLQESAKHPLLPPGGGPSWSVPAYGDVFIQADFQAWQLFVRGLIRTLHGEKGLSYPSTPYE